MKSNDSRSDIGIVYMSIISSINTIAAQVFFFGRMNMSTSFFLFERTIPFGLELGFLMLTGGGLLLRLLALPSEGSSMSESLSFAGAVFEDVV